jgi:hypothetical protein
MSTNLRDKVNTGNSTWKLGTTFASSSVVTNSKSRIRNESSTESGCRPVYEREDRTPGQSTARVTAVFMWSELARRGDAHRNSRTPLGANSAKTSG